MMSSNPSSATSNIVIAQPIVFGSISFWQGQQAPDKHTHKWVVFVRSPTGEDISTFIQKVVFTLHPSFDNQIRTIQSFPFELYQSGWGEFEVQIKIFPQSDGGRFQPIEIIQNLQLYHTHGNNVQSTQQPVVSEFYDEVVFVNPSPKFAQTLRTYVEAPQLDQSQQDQLLSPVNQISNQQSMEEELPSPLENKNDISKEETVIEGGQIEDYVKHYTRFEPGDHQTRLDDALQLVQSEVERLNEEIKKMDQQIIQKTKQFNAIKLPLPNSI